MGRRTGRKGEIEEKSVGGDEKRSLGVKETKGLRKIEMRMTGKESQGDVSICCWEEKEGKGERREEGWECQEEKGRRRKGRARRREERKKFEIN